MARRATTRKKPAARAKGGTKERRAAAPAKGRKAAGGSIVPCLRYRDAPAAIDWLCETFGFERQLVVTGEDGTIAHAQLKLGDGMIMLGTAETASEYGRLMKQPADAGGVTGAIYVVVKEVDAHHARARARGAQVVMEIRDEDYGGRGYTCRDLEGHVWSFGSYDPWS